MKSHQSKRHRGAAAEIAPTASAVPTALMWSRTGKAWRLVGAGNAREHWGASQRRAKAQRSGAAEATRELGASLLSWSGWRVTITRLGPRRLDCDNAVASAKHVRDGVADAVGVDDGNPRFAWAVRQRPSKTFGVEVEIAPLEAPDSAGATPRIDPAVSPHASRHGVGGRPATSARGLFETIAAVRGVDVKAATEPFIAAAKRELAGGPS